MRSESTTTAAFDSEAEEDEDERVTVVSRLPSGGSGPVQTVALLPPLRSHPSEDDVQDDRFVNELEVYGKLMKFDVRQLHNEEGCLKAAEFILILIALLLSGMVVGVSGERGFAMLVCFFGFMAAFALALAKILTLNQQIDSRRWALIESCTYIVLGVAFITAMLLMAILCTLHWHENNPDWQMVPAFASVALGACGVVFFIDACLVFYNRRFRSWSPQKGPGI